MGAGETVAFSSRIELLVSRLGRSSVRSPRFFILTDKAVYIVVTQLVNKQVTTTCERRINLGAISAVGLSNLRDDWVVLNVSNAEEADPRLPLPLQDRARDTLVAEDQRCCQCHHLQQS